MSSFFLSRPAACRRARRPSLHPRGSVLVTALLIAAVLAVGLVSYLSLSRTALKLSHRTLFINDASNLAEAGLEEALYCFNQVSAGTATATAWSGWTTSGATARRTLAPFNRDQSGVGTVKVYVSNYLNSGADPIITSQATIAPFDGGAPIVRVMRLGLTRSGLFINGLVGVSGISLSGSPVIDSFNSNPSNSPTGPWRAYTEAIATSNAAVIVSSGAISLGNGTIKGNLYIGTGVTAPPASQVTGSIVSGDQAAFQIPAYPTAAGVSRSYQIGATVPAVLPVPGHLPAADGRYYYFATGATIANTSITPGANVTIVGTTTSVGSGLAIPANSTLALYVDGAVNASGKGAIANSSWAGAFQIITSTTADISLSGSGELRASVYAPNAVLKASGGGTGGGMVGAFVVKSMTLTGQMNFHYDEALRNLTNAGARPAISSWGEVRLSSDMSALSAATGGFLP